jgi:NtrC-family two-component system sensor histidine kinase KinB
MMALCYTFTANLFVFMQIHISPNSTKRPHRINPDVGNNTGHCSLENKMNTRISIRKPIGLKIFAVSMIPVMALVMVAVINYRHLNSLGSSAEHIMSGNYASIRAAQQARQVLEENRNRVLAFMFQGGREILDILEIDSLGAALSICQAHIAEKGEDLIVGALTENYQRYKGLILLLNQVDKPLPTKDFLDLTAVMVADIHRLVDLNEKGMERSEKEARDRVLRAQHHSVLLLFATILLIVLLGYGLSYRVAQPIRALAYRLAESRRGGDRYPNLPVQSSDEIGLLTDEFNRLFKSLADYDQHNAAILAAEKLKVHQAEEAKARFIADLSHQLKTPITSLSMSVGLLSAKWKRLSAERTGMLLATANDDCDRLATLINELLNIARLEAMIKPAVREKLDVTKMIHECLKPLEKQAEEKGIQLALSIEPDLPTLTLDSLRFPWILTNLVGNALRYTNQNGRVTVKVERRQGRFYFQCSDNGCGIEPKWLPRIFDRYTQFSEREKIGTIGLGLAIVREIIEQHGGDIKAESCPGQGTTFTFWVPEQLEEMDAKSAGGR